MRAPGDVDHVAPTRQSTADNATRSAWRRFIDRYPALRAVSMYSAAVYSSQGLSLFRSFWLASILGPAGFGIWRFLKLVMAYLARVSGLSAEAMRRELPEAIGAGRHERADTIVRTLVSTHVLTGIVVSGLCVLAAVVVPRWWPKVPGWIWLAVGLVAPAQILYELMVTTLHAREHVARYSRITFAFALIAVLLVPLGAILAGLPGALLGLWVSHLVPLGWLIRCGEFPRLCRPRWMTLKPLWAVGFPIWITWILVWILSDIDQWLVAIHLGAAALGLYGIAVGLGILLRFLPKVYRVVYQPYLLRRLGATQDWAGLEPYLTQLLRLIAYTSSIAVAVLFFLAEPLIRIFLPAYQDGLLAAKIYCIATFWCMLPPVTFMICVAAKRTKQWFAQTLILLAIHITVTSFVLNSGGGLVGASICRGVIYAIYSAAQIYLALSFFGAGVRAWFPLAGSLVAPFATCILVCFGLELLWPLSADTFGILVASVGRLSIAISFLGLQYYLAQRRWRFSEVLKSPTGIPGAIDRIIPLEIRQ